MVGGLKRNAVILNTHLLIFDPDLIFDTSAGGDGGGVSMMYTLSCRVLRKKPKQE